VLTFQESKYHKGGQLLAKFSTPTSKIIVKKKQHSEKLKRQEKEPPGCSPCHVGGGPVKGHLGRVTQPAWPNNRYMKKAATARSSAAYNILTIL